MSVRRRQATSAEFKALAHPVRLRILRLCLHDALTNKQIADRLGQNPATVLHHVRTLLDQGFLRAERARTGARGALEKPYRATRKSWTLSDERFPPHALLRSDLAMVDAFRAELIESAPDAERSLARAGLKLNAASRKRLGHRLNRVIEEFVERGDDPDGEPYGVFLGIHRRA